LRIHNLATALEAISRIVEDGEGSSLASATDALTRQFSHFHVFFELYVGRKLIGIKEEITKKEVEIHYLMMNTDEFNSAEL